MTRSKSVTPKATKKSTRNKEPTGGDDVIVAIVDKKRIGGIDHFLVKWGKKSKKDSWEPASDVTKVRVEKIYDTSLAFYTNSQIGFYKDPLKGCQVFD